MNETSLAGTLQIEVSKEISAPRERVWAIVDDSRRLPQWAAAVDQVEECETSERVGAVRRCRVHLSGKPGHMVERCVDRVPEQTIAYVVDDETFGMTRMFDDYGFRLAFEALGLTRSRVTIRTHYSPRNVVVGAMNRMMLRRKLRAVVHELLDGLARAAEQESDPAFDGAA